MPSQKSFFYVFFAISAFFQTKNFSADLTLPVQNNQAQPSNAYAYITPHIYEAPGEKKEILPRALYMSGRTALGAQTIPAPNAHVQMLGAQKYVNHPTGAELFSGQIFANTFDQFLNQLKTIPDFAPLLSKIQFLILNDLYMYLASIYTAFTLTQENKDNYLNIEKETAVNKKAIIVYHLMNLIQSQMHHICGNQLPLIPRNFKLKSGKSLHLNDWSADANFLLQTFREDFFKDIATLTENTTLTDKDFRESAQKVKSTQDKYFEIISKLQLFFNQYTNLLTQTNPKYPYNNKFLELAKTIEEKLENYDEFQKKFRPQDKDSTQNGFQTNLTNQDIKNLKMNRHGEIQDLKTTDNKKMMWQLANHRQNKNKPINPPLFYYDKPTLRSIKLIPKLADQIPQNIKSVGWPEQLIKKAQSGELAQGQEYQLVYFLDANLNPTKNIKDAKQMFINIPSDKDKIPYSQEIKKQPEWLNSKEGIIKILRACLGDFSNLIGMDILAPCTEQILCSACEKSPFAESCNLCGPSKTKCLKEIEIIKETRKKYFEDKKGKRETEKIDIDIINIPEEEIDQTSIRG